MNVVLYSTNCPKCKVLEKKLDLAGIDYSIETNVDVMLEKGFSSAPMLVVDGVELDFSKAVKWLNGDKSAFAEKSFAQKGGCCDY